MRIREDARGYCCLPVRSRPLNLERHCGGAFEPAGACLASLFRFSEQRGSWHLGNHGLEGQVEDLCVALTRPLHLRRCRWPPARQVPSARLGTRSTRARGIDRPHDATIAAARSASVDGARDDQVYRRDVGHHQHAPAAAAVAQRASACGWGSRMPTAGQPRWSRPCT